MNPDRSVAFVVASTNQGTFIVNRFDYCMVDQTSGFGVGFLLLETATYVRDEATGMLMLLDLCHQYSGDGVVALDCGANLGVFTVQWANHMTGWGTVTAIEAQERVFYALAGNIAINNCFNARAIHAAVGADQGSMRIPSPDYRRPGSYGSLELRYVPETEFIGQEIDYGNLTAVPLMTIDSLALRRLDMLKIDVERMELEALAGAKETITRLKPLIIVECVKASADELTSVLASYDYCWFPFGQNFIAVHTSSPIRDHIVTT